MAVPRKDWSLRFKRDIWCFCKVSPPGIEHLQNQKGLRDRIGPCVVPWAKMATVQIFRIYKVQSNIKWATRPAQIDDHI